MFVLEEIFKSQKAENSDHFNLRIHRGISWLKKANLLDDDLDLKFISLWVSFNAIYAQDLNSVQDNQTFERFLHQMCQLDRDHKIDHLIWDKFNQQIRLLVENPYRFQPFWDYQNQKISQGAWKADFEIEKKRVLKAVQDEDSVVLLSVVFNRLYTLRNQIIHGGSTYNSSVNRQQIQDSGNILNALLPVFIRILLENAQTLDLGKSFYPVVQVS